VQPPNQHLSLSAKMNGTQKKALVRMYCTHCSIPKGTSRAKATVSRTEKIKHVALAIIKLHARWSEGISQLVSQSVENSIKQEH